MPSLTPLPSLTPDAGTSALPRLALTTLAVYDSVLEGAACSTTSLLGMVGWCQGASRLASALAGVAHVSTVILTNQSSSIAAICPDAKLLDIDASVSSLVQRWASTHGDEFDPMSSGADSFTLANLQKLQLLGLEGYDAMLFSDGDIILLGRTATPDVVASVRDMWAQRLPGFLADPRAEILGAPDHSAPINGGLWLLKPSRSAYDDAVGVLQRNLWNVSHGFDLVGSPASLVPSIYASCNRADRISVSQFVTSNDWHCVGCGTDQGALFYTFHVLREGRYKQSEGSGPTVAHWWAHPKPWELKAEAEADLAQRAEYFRDLDLADDATRTPTAAQCVAKLRTLSSIAEQGVANAQGWVKSGPLNPQHVFLLSSASGAARGGARPARGRATSTASATAFRRLLPF